MELNHPPIIGRFGTSLKIVIVGLPNVGNSVFFSVSANSQASAENFPLCTIDPNESRAPVPDERFDFLCQYHKPAGEIPAFLNVVNTAGLGNRGIQWTRSSKCLFFFFFFVKFFNPYLKTFSFAFFQREKGRNIDRLARLGMPLSAPKLGIRSPNDQPNEPQHQG